MASDPDEAVLLLEAGVDKLVAGLLISPSLAIAPCVTESTTLAPSILADRRRPGPNRRIPLERIGYVGVAPDQDLGLWRVKGTDGSADRPPVACRLRRVPGLGGEVQVYRSTPSARRGAPPRLGPAGAGWLTDPASDSRPSLWAVEDEAVLGSPVVVDNGVVAIVALVQDGFSYLVTLADLATVFSEIGPWIGWRIFDSESHRRLWLGNRGLRDRFSDRQELKCLEAAVGSGARLIFVEGPSGSGKSSVVARFAAEGDPAIRKGLEPSCRTGSSLFPRVQAFLRLEGEVRELALQLADVLEVDEDGRRYIKDAPTATKRFARLDEVQHHPHPVLVIDGVSTRDKLDLLLKAVCDCPSLRFIICAPSDVVQAVAFDPIEGGSRATMVKRVLVKLTVDDTEIERYLSARGLDPPDVESGVRFSRGHLLLAGLYRPGIEDHAGGPEVEVAERVDYLVEGIVAEVPAPARLVLPHLKEPTPIELVNMTLKQLNAPTFAEIMADHAALNQVLDVDPTSVSIRHDHFSESLSEIVEDSEGQVCSALLGSDPTTIREQRCRDVWSRLVCATAEDHGRLHDLVSATVLLPAVNLADLAPRLRRTVAQSPRWQLLEAFDESVESADWVASVLLVESGHEVLTFESAQSSNPEVKISWSSTGSLLAHWWRLMPDDEAAGSTEPRGAMTDEPEEDLAAPPRDVRPEHSRLDLGGLNLADLSPVGKAAALIRNSGDNYLVAADGDNAVTTFNVHPDCVGAHVELTGSRHVVLTSTPSGELGIATLVSSPNPGTVGGEASWDQQPAKLVGLDWAAPTRSPPVVACVESSRVAAFAYVDDVAEFQCRTIQAEGPFSVTRKTWSTIQGLRLTRSGVECVADAGVLSFEPVGQGPMTPVSRA